MINNLFFMMTTYGADFYSQTSQQAQNANDLVDFIIGWLAILSGFTVLMAILSIVIPIIIIILWVTLPIICAVHAYKKGYSWIGFYLYGLLCFPIAMGVIFLANPKLKKQTGPTEEQLIAEVEEYYNSGSISYTQRCQKIDEIKRSKYY